ncbi:chromate transporter [Phyllobacterium sp. CL33Tsu]|uniref:chromate transporter n=1 Tax=Phyllobacterium sp. CL33Tsu TaxID=1798191 RepID=UPI0008E021B6|nr:chromate transporter [Phyllobacterium sp. CL33Tsu]SFJ41317.1 chromate transporter [Phyllobacterium sp. CL33Tsu]
MRFDTLIAIALVFIPFSLTSIGGGSAIVAGIQHEAVTVHGWVSSREFLDLFAVSRAAPGPGMMLATVIGWRVAGWLGAAIATLALFVPSSMLCYAVFKLTNNHRQKRWHRAMREGLAPVGIGLIIAGIISLFRLSHGGPSAIAIIGLAAAIFLWMPRFPVLGVLVLGGLVAALAATGF